MTRVHSSGVHMTFNHFSVDRGHMMMPWRSDQPMQECFLAI